MENYKSLYLMLFNRLTDLRGEIDAIQRAAEEWVLAMEAGEPNEEDDQAGKIDEMGTV